MPCLEVSVKKLERVWGSGSKGDTVIGAIFPSSYVTSLYITSSHIMFPLQPQLPNPKPAAPNLTPMDIVFGLEAGGMRIEAGGLEIRSL